jgi:hypothetical protein
MVTDAPEAIFEVVPEAKAGDAVGVPLVIAAADAPESVISVLAKVKDTCEKELLVIVTLYEAPDKAVLVVKVPVMPFVGAAQLAVISVEVSVPTLDKQSVQVLFSKLFTQLEEMS